MVNIGQRLQSGYQIDLDANVPRNMRPLTVLIGPRRRGTPEPLLGSSFKLSIGIDEGASEGRCMDADRLHRRCHEALDQVEMTNGVEFSFLTRLCMVQVCCACGAS